MTDSYIFSGLKILIKNEWVQDHAVLVENKIIKAILPAASLKNQSAKCYQFPPDYFLIPGLIDLHTHGANGFDVMDGKIEALMGISHVLAKEGVTGFLATTMTAVRERMENVLKAIADVMPNKEGASILGVHLEGPFISHEKMGAQQGCAIEKPDITLIQYWQKIANKAIKLVTLAPELPQANALIKCLKEMEIVISVGHTNATYVQTQEAISLGCSHATHLFNAMRGLHQREPGAVGALLLNENVSAELIVDGLHLHPAIIDLALRVKGNEKFILVTDAIRAKCLGDGEYELGGQMVKVSGNKATLSDGRLAGSVMTLPQAIKNMMAFTSCSLADAVKMASYNPAKILGLTSHKGCIEEGKDADLVVMDASLNVMMTMREGSIIYNKQKSLS